VLQLMRLPQKQLEAQIYKTSRQILYFAAVVLQVVLSPAHANAATKEILRMIRCLAALLQHSSNTNTLLCVAGGAEHCARQGRHQNNFEEQSEQCERHSSQFIHCAAPVLQVVLSTAHAKAATKEILSMHCISSDRSPDLPGAAAAAEDGAPGSSGAAAAAANGTDEAAAPAAGEKGKEKAGSGKSSRRR
jgi:hypothetical protein